MPGQTDDKAYFYSNGTQQYGPFSFDELKIKRIDRDTLIWYKGLSDWTKASELKNMESILELIPPPLPKIEQIDNTPPPLHIPKENENENDIPNKESEYTEGGRRPNPFSFNGRIGRLEFFWSFALAFILNIFLQNLLIDYPIAVFGIFGVCWFISAQGAKRCHDIGKSGWIQFIPFYNLILFFQKGEQIDNEYGPMVKD